MLHQLQSYANDDPNDIIFCSSTMLDCCTLSTLRGITPPADSDDPGNCLNLDLNWTCLDGDCLQSCQNMHLLYDIPTYHFPHGITESLPLYNFCVGLANIVGFHHQGLLSSNFETRVAPVIAQNLSSDDLRHVADSLTHCLISTCDQAKSYDICASKCSPSTLLINATTPSYSGIFDCLESLCTESRARPYDNFEFVGIGVFTSYFIQCSIAIIASILLAFPMTDIYPHMSRWPRLLQRHEEKLITSIVDFQKAQCYFGIAVQVASFVSGSSTSIPTALLVPILLVSVSTNGILPSTLNLLVIHYFGRSSVYLSVITFISWLMASIVFWRLYTWTFYPLYWFFENGTYLPRIGDGSSSAGASLALSLGDLPACGQQSARALCHNFDEPIPFELNTTMTALSWTPLIWVLCTLCLMSIFLEQIGRNLKGFAQRYRTILILVQGHIASWLPTKLRNYLSKRKLSSSSIFQLTILSFLCLFGFQFYLFSKNIRMGLVDTTSWGFGQILAIFAWVPPVVEYVYVLFAGIIDGSNYRLAKTLTVARIDSLQVAIRTNEETVESENGILMAPLVGMQAHRSATF